MARCASAGNRERRIDAGVTPSLVKERRRCQATVKLTLMGGGGEEGFYNMYRPVSKRAAKWREPNVSLRWHSIS